MNDRAIPVSRLRQALNNGEFVPYIQPVVRASDLSVTGGELLTRWHTPDGTLILPGEFIARVEPAGLLPALTCRMMQQAVNGITGTEGGFSRDFRLAVNVTPALLTDSRFTEACLTLAGPLRLVAELTEQAPFHTDGQTVRTLKRLHDAGVELALDDFGTGCSVLSYLKYFPVRYLKMDRDFVRDILYEDASRHIAECIVALARKRHIRTVAEGVESREQADYLRTLGVDYLQGYHTGAPEALHTFIRLYRREC